MTLIERKFNSFNSISWLSVTAILSILGGGTCRGQVAVEDDGRSTFSAGEGLKEHLIFFSSFDGGVTADFAVGEKQLFTADNRRSLADAKPGLHDEHVELATGQGLVGDALQFKKKDRRLIFYRAKQNVAYREKSWSGAVSLWLQVDPSELEPGYCDPIQITDSAYNDAAIWVDFTKENPRDFRLGVIGDLNSWNPNKISPDNNPEFEKRLVTVKQPPFDEKRWTHVLINFSGLNSNGGTTQFYLNGQLKGARDVTDPFTWDEERANIQLGLSYVGLMDELAIFDRPLNEKEIRAISQSDRGLKTLIPIP